jgi:hypothetical protein
MICESEQLISRGSIVGFYISDLAPPTHDMPCDLTTAFTIVGSECDEYNMLVMGICLAASSALRPSQNHELTVSLGSPRSESQWVGDTHTGIQT